MRLLSAHSELSADDQHAILSVPMTMRSFGSGEVISGEGRAVSTCAILDRGFAVRQKLTGLGDRLIVSIYGPGDALNFQDVFLEDPDSDIVATEDCVVSIVAASAIKLLSVERPAVARSLLVSAYIEVSIAREWMLNIGRRDAKARLAFFLCEYLTCIRGNSDLIGKNYEMGLSQEQIADCIGLTAVHVNRTFKALCSENIIKQRGRYISVPNMGSLERAGDYGRGGHRWRGAIIS